MARAVVTGGNGFVGSHLVDRLLARGDEVVVFDTRGARPAPAPSWKEVEYVRGSVSSSEQLAKAVRGGVDVVYHLAAVVGVDRYLESPMEVIDVNFTGTRNVLDLAERAGAKVVFASTSEVFGKNPDVPWKEDADRVLGTTSASRWSYSSSKALAEHLTFGYMGRGLNASIVRYFNLYGPRQRPAFLVSRSLHRALRGEPPVVYDEGGQTRSFTYIDDAVEATVEIGTRPEADGECFNVGSSDEVTIREAVDLIVEMTGGGVVPTSIDTRDRFGHSYQDLDRRIPDAGKIRSLLGWKSTTSLREGVARTIEWAEENPWWLEQPENTTG
ncbi:NAD-dependent epimerase/dehydratase family protein [Nocardiopsis akebiae]|uniref:NAD-dependent epimerase/dehydratase family protein n=1 Tax=Nocardiopsis akebiae TaxID=2831968 RepID=A0ABX8C5C4_9ACTN|nr:NAD-dependent epimerase/dehydratase family protein [Nocardiopsis akebiae]QUX29322.1 NAD-dependent epimerase/dehydratase family protein [Nocardiopsis akebiae]